VTFFWSHILRLSPGDIASPITLLVKDGKMLKDFRVAATEYQGAVKFSTSIQGIRESLQTLLE
jgi:hypothetical protein